MSNTNDINNTDNTNDINNTDNTNNINNTDNTNNINNTDNTNDTNDTNDVYIQKMIFVFNALLSGWSIKMINNNTFEFKKENYNQEVNLDSYLKTFLTENLNVNNIKKLLEKS